MAKERFELSDSVQDLLSGMGKLSAEMKDNSAKAMEYAQSMDKLAKQNTELTKLNEALSTSFSKVSNALNKASSGNDLTKYIKSQENMIRSIDKTYRRYLRESDEIKKNNLSEELYKEVNALKAVTGKTDLSEFISNFDGVKTVISSVSSYIKSEFSVSAFKEINETIEVLEQAGLKIRNVFSTLDKGSQFYDIDRELRETREQLDLINNADVSELTGKLEKLSRIAENEFNTFLNLYNLSKSDYKFYDIFEEIRSGALTSQQAIERVKNEFDYLLIEAKSSGNQHYDILNSSAIREMVENISTLHIKIDEIITKISGVPTENHSLEIFDEEQFNRLLILFEKIESSLSSMKAVFVDVGDGEEFSPLLKMIDNVQSSIKELSTSVSDIKLDVNMDLGSEVNERLNQKISQSMNRQLEAYRNLYSAMKASKKTNKEMLRFYEPEDASISEIIGAYKGVIKRAEDQYGKDVYKKLIGKEAYDSYLKEIKNATDQFNRATNKKNVENPLGDLFGKNELVEVISQLGLIADKLSEISSTVSGFGNTFENVFKDGFNVSASVEEIEKLTSRVKELEDELFKVKINPVADDDKSNISSGNGIVDSQNKIQEELTETENLMLKIYRAYNKMSGVVGEVGISWFSDDLDTMKTYLNHYKDRELISGDIDVSKLLSLDAQGSKHNAITYLGDYSDEASIKITDLYNAIQKVKSELEKTPNDTGLSQQLKELELEYDKLSEDTSNLYGTHTTNWFAIQAKEAGYLGIAIKNVIDDYNGLIDKPTTTVALFDINLLENQEKITDRIRENVESIKGFNFDVAKSIESDANSFVENISSEDLEDEIREIQEFNSLMKLTQMTSEELGEVLREVFSYAHENPDVLDNLYDYNPNLVDVFDKNTNIGKYFDELISSTDWNVDDSQLESIYLDFAKKLQDYEISYIESVKKKLNIIANDAQSNNTNVEDSILSNNKIQEELKETQEQAEKTQQAIKEVSDSTIEDVFQSDNNSSIKFVDNFGRELDEVNSKLLKGTALLNEQGQLIRLYHGSDVEFDKFDLSKSTNLSNQIYGKGAYLIETEKGAQGYGNVVTEWYANIRKVLHEEQNLTLEEAQKLYNEFGSELLNIYGERMNFDEFFDNYLSFDPDQTTIVEKLKRLSGFLGKDIGDILTPLGYDAIKIDRNNGSFYSIFDPNRVIRFKDEAQKAVDSVEELDRVEETLNSSIGTNSKNVSSTSSAAKEESDELEKVAEAAKGAIQAKEDFATANEGVRDSVADSKSPLQLEAELMQQITKDARDAADAKKEFVEANRELEKTAITSTSALELENEEINNTTKTESGQKETNDNKSVEESIKRSTESVRQANEELSEYKNNVKVLSQVGEIGDDKYSITSRLNDGQIQVQSWKAKRDEKGNYVYDEETGKKEYDESSQIISDYEKLEKTIVNADNALRKMQDTRKEILSLDENASTYFIDAQIEDQKQYIILLEQTIEYIASLQNKLTDKDENEYSEKAFKIDPAAIQSAREKAAREHKLSSGVKQEKSDAKQSASDEQKRLKNIEQVNRSLNKRQILIDSIEKTYDKSKNPDLDKSVSVVEDLEELSLKKKEIQDLINELKDQDRNASNEDDFLKLERLVTEYKELAKYKLKANNPSEQTLGGQDLKVAIEKQISQYEILILKAEKYGEATEDIVEKLKEQRDILSKTNDNGERTASANDYINARNEYKIAKSQVDTISAYDKEIESENKKETKEQTSRQKNTWKNFEQEDIDENKRAYEELIDAIQRYSTVAKKIASNEALDEDLALAEELENKISNLQKQPILSSSQIEHSEKLLRSLFDQLDTIEQATKQKEVSSALKQQEQAWKKIQSIREQIAKTDPNDENTISLLKDAEKAYKKKYLEAGRVLRNNRDSYDVEAHKNNLRQIALETSARISQYDGRNTISDDALNILIEQQIAAYDKLILRAEKYGEKTADIVENLQAQRNILAETDDDGNRTATAGDYYSSKDNYATNKAALDSREVEIKKEKEYWDINLAKIQEYMDAVTKLNKLKASGVGSNKNAEEINTQEQLVAKLKKEALDARVELSSFNPHYVDMGTWRNWLDMMEQFRQASKGSDESVAKLEDSIRNVNNSTLSSVTSEIDSFQKKIDSIAASRSPVDQSTEFQNYVHRYQELINELREEKKKLDDIFENSTTEVIQDSDLDKVQNLEKELFKLNNEFKLVFKGSSENSRAKEIDTITKYMEKNTRISGKATDELNRYLNILKNNGADADINEIHVAFLKVCDAERAAGREGKSFLDVIKDKAWYGLASQIGTYFGLNDIINYARQGIEVVREFDTALTEMRKVSDESVYSLKNYQAETFDVADAVGTTALQIQNSTADYMRLGESIDSAAESAKVANILLNVSEFDNIEDATNSLVSMGQAYKDLDKIEIVDKLNEVGNNYAISTDELATSLQKSAATLSLMGNTIDESAALITTANSVLQDADSVSAGMRTISLRIVGTEEAEEELSALDEEVDSFVKATNSKKQQIIKDYTAVASNNYQGFDILDENGNYKNTYEINYMSPYNENYMLCA